MCARSLSAPLSWLSIHNPRLLDMAPDIDLLGVILDSFSDQTPNLREKSKSESLPDFIFLLTSLINNPKIIHHWASFLIIIIHLSSICKRESFYCRRKIYRMRRNLVSSNSGPREMDKLRILIVRGQRSLPTNPQRESENGFPGGSH